MDRRRRFWFGNAVVIWLILKFGFDLLIIDDSEVIAEGFILEELTTISASTRIIPIQAWYVSGPRWSEELPHAATLRAYDTLLQRRSRWRTSHKAGYLHPLCRTLRHDLFALDALGLRPQHHGAGLINRPIFIIKQSINLIILILNIELIQYIILATLLLQTNAIGFWFL